MTITPLPLTPAAPATGGAGAPTGQPGSAAAALFGLLVGQHLEAATIAVPTVPAPAPPVGQPTSQPAGQPLALPTAPPSALPTAAPSAPADATVAPAPTVLPDVAPAALPTNPRATAATPTPGPTPAPVPAGAKVDNDTDTDTDEPEVTADGGTATASPLPTLTAGLAGVPLVVLPVPTTGQPVAATTDEPGESRTAPEPSAGPTPGTGVVVGPTPSGTDATAGRAATPTQVVAAAPADGTSASLAAGLTPVVTTGATAATPSSTSTTASAVLDQVLPAVPRLVVRGDGTTRLTLKLHPADLGEVHLTVSVRGKEVDVTVAAGAQAREALSEGSSRLRSLLEGIGHTTGQVILRDLPTGAANQSAGIPFGGQSFGQSNNQSNNPTNQPGGQFAGQPSAQGDGRSDAQAYGRPDGAQHDGSRRDADSSSTRPTGTGRHLSSAAAGLDVTI